MQPPVTAQAEPPETTLPLKMDPISKALGEHYAEKFSAHGPTSEGVDWGPDKARAFLRYERMLSVADFASENRGSLLDVGCGYGGLQQYATRKNVDLDYTGIDVAANMIDWARANLPDANFIHGDVLDHKFDREFDYVVCNGILTQKLETSGIEMDQFAGRLIHRVFSLCTIGVAFNVMTTKVNYFANNLYYRNPAELFSWCLNEITPHVKLVEKIYSQPTNHLAEFNINAIEQIAQWLGLAPRFMRSSAMGVAGASTERLVGLCEAVSCDVYVTGHGALNYLKPQQFEDKGISVRYMDYRKVPYGQEHIEFTPYVSILDAIASCGERARDLLCSDAIYWRDLMSVEDER